MTDAMKLRSETPFTDEIEKWMNYSIALQKAIETHCRGEFIGEPVLSACPRHAVKLNELRAQARCPAKMEFPCSCYLPPDYNSCDCRNSDDALRQGYAKGWNACVEAMAEPAAPKSGEG